MNSILHLLYFYSHFHEVYLQTFRGHLHNISFGNRFLISSRFEGFVLNLLGNNEYYGNHCVGKRRILIGGAFLDKGQMCHNIPV